jgi:hypothetical protein
VVMELLVPAKDGPMLRILWRAGRGDASGAGRIRRC